jgi:uncharacterized cupredoxin-like copper-binding protein
VSPSRSRQAQRCGEEARARPGTTAARRKPAPARAKGRRGRRRRGIPPLLWAGALVGLLAIVAVVLARPGADRSDQGARHRESGEVTVSGEQLPVLSQAGTDPAVGRRAPALSGTDFEGRPVATAASGKPQVVILLAHWCPHCRNEVPRITSWLRQAGTPAGVSLVSVSTGTDNARPNYPPSAWLGRERWPLPVVVDDTSGTAAKAYGLSGFPFFVFIDADGTVAGRYAGELDVEDLQARIQSLRASEPATASTSAAAPPLVDVTMGEMWFKASRVQVPAGRPVRLRFRNAGKVAHQALVGTQAEQDAAEARGGEGGPAGRTITLGPGETGELVVTVPRGTTLLLGCHLPGHWPAGMRGSVFGT